MERHHGVLVDNLTLQGAVRLVTAPREQPPGYPYVPMTRLHGIKCDYELNDAFRTAVDLACLAQMVQSIILYDVLIVDAEYADRWYRPAAASGHPGGGSPSVPSLLDTLVRRLTLPRQRMLHHRADASRRIERYAGSDVFKDYMQLLATTSLDAAFVHISNAYFHTGFSDPVLFPSDEFDTAGLFSALPTEQDLAVLKDVVRFEELVGDVSGHRPNHLLSRTPYDPSALHDKAGAAADIMRNARAALYYRNLADELGVAYLPHPLRSAFVSFDVEASHHGLPSVGGRVNELLRASRASKAAPVNRSFNREVVHVDIPFFLAAVLREVRSPAEILQTAVAVRESWQGVELRSWTREVEEALAGNTAGIGAVAERLEAARAIVEGGAQRPPLAEGQSEDVVTVGLDFAISRPGGTGSLCLLQSVSEVTDATPNFAALVSHVFGRPIGLTWERYRETVERFRNVETWDQSKDYSPLSR